MGTTTMSKPVARHVGNRRLLKLAAYLATIPGRRFDYWKWVGQDWKGKPDLSCGTRACALGWATTMPEFRRLGLSMVKEEPSPNGRPTLRGHPNLYPVNVAALLFGISLEEATYLFIPRGEELNATPLYVARKIERFVKTRAA